MVNPQAPVVFLSIRAMLIVMYIQLQVIQLCPRVLLLVCYAVDIIQALCLILAPSLPMILFILNFRHLESSTLRRRLQYQDCGASMETSKQHYNFLTVLENPLKMKGGKMCSVPFFSLGTKKRTTVSNSLTLLLITQTVQSKSRPSSRSYHSSWARTI